MSIYEESGLRFDFTRAKGSIVHDKEAPGDGNNVWKGVDFRVFEDDKEIWIEAKSWSFKRVVDRVERTTFRKDFHRKLSGTAAEAFGADIFHKFLGTTAYLAWTGKPLPSKVLYVIFLEPPDRGSVPLLLPFRDRLRERFKQAQATPWGKDIGFQVVSIEQFNAQFPDYPVALVRPSPKV